MKTMIVVDDSAFARTTVKIVASKLDVIVVGEADNGKAAVKMYKELMPDVVVMDIAMDDMDGISALREIMEHNPNAAVLMLSSIAGQEMIKEDAMAAGAKAVFMKPINKQEFIDEVTKYL